ncbi:MAG: hypothetical protein ACI9X4_002367 [Glaciecola sp.]|jgi:hypothetical protein
MQIFDLLFPVFMIAFPAVMALFLRTKEATDQADTVHLERRLWLATGLFLILAAAAWSMRFLPEWSSQAALLPVTVWKFIPSGIIAQAGFCVLWFKFALPLIRVYRPGFDGALAGQTPAASDPVRSASLTPRQPPAALHSTSAVWTLGLWLVGLAIFVYGWKTHGIPAGKSASQHLILCGIPLVAALSVALMIPLGHRTMFLAPEPLHAGRSPELAQAYRNKHTCQSRMILVSILFVITLILLFPLALAFHVQITGSQWGLVGGIFGSVVGVGGGAVGTLLSVHRLKIHRIEQTQ